MGCLWYASRALIAYLSGIGLSTSELRKTTKELEAAAELALCLIVQALLPQYSMGASDFSDEADEQC